MNEMRETPAGLPSTIEALRLRLRNGELSVAESLTRQHDALRGDAWHCVDHVEALPPSWPSLSRPLAGVGLAHKDIFVLPHRQPGCGAGRPPSGWQSSGPATVVQRLSTAGAPPLAMLGMAAYACGATAENETASPMLNPIDAGAAVGGSSSGSGVAVAAGLCYAALGTDTAGSVRMPAATCGVVGLKTTYGLLPRDGVAPLAPSLDTVGVLARCSSDLMAVFSHAVAPVQAQAFHAAHDRALRDGLRIAVAWTHASTTGQLSNDVAQALDALACSLNAPAERRIDPFGELPRLADILLHAEAAHVHTSALQGNAPLPQLVRNLALTGSAIPLTWYEAARRAQSIEREAFLRTALAEIDILLTPALPQGVPDVQAVTTSSPEFQARQLLAMFSWMPFVNYLGLPAIVLPIARDIRGRPICVQAIARPGQEGQLLAWAQQIEQRWPENFLSSPYQ